MESKFDCVPNRKKLLYSMSEYKLSTKTVYKYHF